MSDVRVPPARTDAAETAVPAADDLGAARLCAGLVLAHASYAESGAQLRLRTGGATLRWDAGALPEHTALVAELERAVGAEAGSAELSDGRRALAVLRWGAGAAAPTLTTRLDPRLAAGLAELVALQAAAGGAPAAPPAHQALLAAFNDTGQDYRLGETITGIVGAHARRDPDRVAIEQRGETLTYGELHARADAVARALPPTRSWIRPGRPSASGTRSAPAARGW
jgi:non-ribosomal peptide synthetase component F